MSLSCSQDLKFKLESDGVHQLLYFIVFYTLQLYLEANC